MKAARRATTLRTAPARLTFVQFSGGSLLEVNRDALRTAPQ